MTAQEIYEQFKGRIHCSQIVACEYAEQLGYDRDEVCKIANPFGGGMFCGDTCGAVSGAMLAIGMKYGNSEHGNKEQDDLCIEKIKEFQKEFAARYNSTICRELLGYDFRDSGQKKAAFSDGRVKEVCPCLVRDVIDILGRLLDD